MPFHFHFGSGMRLRNLPADAPVGQVFVQLGRWIAAPAGGKPWAQLKLRKKLEEGVELLWTEDFAVRPDGTVEL